MDRIEQDRIDLHRAAEQYINGEIEWEEWDAIRTRCMPDYDAMGRHLYRVSQQHRKDQQRAYRRSFWRGVFSLFGGGKEQGA